jgi:SAM-dependent methyltransferase
VDLEEYRQQSREIWGRVAPRWKRDRAVLWSVSAPVAEDLVARLDPQPGETILDLAAGVGETGFLAAEAIGPDGRLISTDFAASMVDAAREVGSELGLESAEYRVLDAERMDLEDSSVDGVLCRWGYMLMADPAAAFGETRRVLRDGGRLAFSVWAGPDRNPWAFIPGGVLVARGHMPPPEEGAPGIFTMGDPGRIRELVTGAGFSEVEIEELPVGWDYPSLEDYWTFLTETAGPMALALAELSEDDRAEVRAAIEEQAGPRLEEDPKALNGVCLNVIAS